MLEAYRGDSWLTVEEAAEHARMTIRTLQRRLAGEKQSYSGLLDRVRFEAALQLHQDPDNKIIDIAFELGYTDPANFARAFHRWAGISPSEFRRQRASMAAD